MAPDQGRRDLHAVLCCRTDFCKSGQVHWLRHQLVQTAQVPWQVHATANQLYHILTDMNTAVEVGYDYTTSMLGRAPAKDTWAVGTTFELI